MIDNPSMGLTMFIDVKNRNSDEHNKIMINTIQFYITSPLCRLSYEARKITSTFSQRVGIMPNCRRTMAMEEIRASVGGHEGAGDRRMGEVGGP